MCLRMRMRRVWWMLKKQGIVLALFLEIAIFSLLSSNFFSSQNAMLILRQCATIGVMGCGMTFVIIGGNFDLSVGSLLSLCCCISLTMHDYIGAIPAILFTLLVSVASGAISGFLVGYVGLNSMIVTLGMMNVLQALALIWTDGKYYKLQDLNTWFTQIGKGNIGGIVPISTLIMIGVIIIYSLILNKTVYGYYIKAAGGNLQTCRYSGIDDKKVIFKSFILSGLATGIGAILLSSRSGSAQSTVGAGYEFDVIAGVILGGTSLSGGSGNVFKSFIGVLIMFIMKNGFIMIGLPYYIQWIAQGVIIITSVLIDNMSRRKKGV